MGLIYAEIEMINVEDLTLAKKHIIGQEEIRRTTVNALVDTGAIMLTINDSIKEQLGLDVNEYRTCQTADGRIMKLEVVGPIEVKFKIGDLLPRLWLCLAKMRFCLELSRWKKWMFSFILHAKNSLSIPIIRILHR
jgi:hypothetical protein